MGNVHLLRRYGERTSSSNKPRLERLRAACCLRAAASSIPSNEPRNDEADTQTTSDEEVVWQDYEEIDFVNPCTIGEEAAAAEEALLWSSTKGIEVDTPSFTCAASEAHRQVGVDCKCCYHLARDLIDCPATKCLPRGSGNVLSNVSSECSDREQSELCKHSEHSELRVSIVSSGW